VDKREKLEKLLSRLKSGKAGTKELEKLFIEDTNGQQVPLNSPEAIAAIERRLAQIDASQDIATDEGEHRT